MTPHKRPESVLVVVHTPDGRILLLKRSDHPDFWQSVTGSLEWGEQAPDAARREVCEETGIEAGSALRDLNRSNCFTIFPEWRARYAPGVTENLEHAFALVLPAERRITLNPAEHSTSGWFGWQEAAEKVASWSNREIILEIARREGWVS